MVWLWALIPSLILNIILVIALKEEMDAYHTINRIRVDDNWKNHICLDENVYLKKEIRELKKSNRELKAFIFANLKGLYKKEK